MNTVCGNIIAWFDAPTTTAGVPQDSISGPLLFVTYASDLIFFPVSVYQFAGDTTVVMCAVV